jgi:hypothetical protein
MVDPRLYNHIIRNEETIMESFMTITLLDLMVVHGTRQCLRARYDKVKVSECRKLLSLPVTPCSWHSLLYSSLCLLETMALCSIQGNPKHKTQPSSPSIGHKLTLQQRDINAHCVYYASTSTRMHQDITQILHRSQ